MDPGGSSQACLVRHLPTQPLCSSLMEATLYCHVCHMLLFHTSQDSLWIDSSFILIVIRTWPIMHLSFFVHKPWRVHHPYSIMVRYFAVILRDKTCFIHLAVQRFVQALPCFFLFFFKLYLFFNFHSLSIIYSHIWKCNQTPLAHENRWKGKCIPVTCSFICWTTQVCLSIKFLPVC